jgi:signal transduction histidine kinase
VNLPLLAVIDDEKAIRRLLLVAFRERYNVQLFESAEDFRETFKTDAPHVLIVDKNLPGLTGLELIKLHQREHRDFEAVLITAYADMDSAITAVELGVYSYLRKPFETDVLIGTVAGAYERLTLRMRLRESNELLARQNKQLDATVKELSATLEKLRQSEAARAMSERLATLGQVSASVAHELNTALSYVINNTHLLQGMIPGLQAMKSALKTQGRWDALLQEHKALGMHDELPDIVGEVNTGLEIIHQLSTDMNELSRSSERTTTFDLRESVKIGVRMASATSKNVAVVTVNVPDQPISFCGVHHRMVQVVMNLLVNASEAIRAKIRKMKLRRGEVEVTLESRGDEVVVQISDNGCGIPQERLDEICKPFVTYSQRGTGLGLALVRSIVEDHGGSIHFESQEGEGTTVTISLPLNQKVPE